MKFRLMVLLLTVYGWVGAMNNKNNNFVLTAAEFKNNSSIPSQYTCDGENSSPALSWRNAPEGTKSFTLIVDDPDAPRGTFVHWVVFNIPAQVTQLSASAGDTLNGALQGTNSFGKKRYGGPCPPNGEHRYFFKLYALDIMLSLKAGATKEQVLSAMQGHVVAQAELVGLYKRL